MTELPWIVRKVVDFEDWLNQRVLRLSEEQSQQRLLAGARTHCAVVYIQEKYGMA